MREIEIKSTLLEIGLNHIHDLIKMKYSSRLGPLRWFNSKPWYLIIGSPQSGKTALVKNAGLDFIGDGEYTDAYDNHYTWWLTDKAILVELSPHRRAPDELKQASRLFPTRSRPKLAGIIACFGIEEMLVANSEKQNETIIEQLSVIAHCFGNALPIYLLNTKMDLLCGFSAFFSDLAPNEQRQSWGIQLDLKSSFDPDAYTRSFKQEYSALLERLNKRLIARLHHERCLSDRILISDFPLQFESIKGIISYTLDQIERSNTGEIRGVYFCSAIQQGVAIDRLKRPLSQIFDIATVPAQSLPLLNKAYFIHDLFNHVTSAINNDNFKRTGAYRGIQAVRKTGMMTAFACIVILTCFWGHNFKSNINAFNSAEKTLAKYEVLSRKAMGGHINELLAALNALEEVKSTVASPSSPHYPLKWLTIRPDTSLISQSNAIYHQALIKTLLPIIQKDLATDLAEQTHGDPYRLYDTLQVYLMLTKPKYLNPEMVTRWVTKKANSFKNFSLSQRNQLALHVANLLQNPLPPLPIDLKNIELARKQLQSVPKPLLALFIMRNHVSDTFSDPFSLKKDNSRVFSFGGQTKGIPSIYTAAHFHPVFFNQIKSASKQALEGNWILGKLAKPSDMDTDDLAMQVRPYYISNYIQYWQNQLNQIHITPLNNLSRASRVLAKLADDLHSPLIKIFDQLRNNVEIHSTKLIDEPHQIYQSFKPLLQLVQKDNVQPELLVVLAHLHQLSTYVNGILTSPEPDKSAFEAVKHRFTITDDRNQDPISLLMNDAQHVPAPLSNWIRQITENTWGLLIAQAHEHIDDRWRTMILPAYKQKLENRFPLFSDSRHEINLTDFNHFFNPQGLYSTFFSDYILPFVDTTQTQWRNNTLDGLTLGFDKETIKQFEKANIIRTMFFEMRATFPNVDFELKPVALHPTVANVAFEIDGDRFKDALHESKAHSIHWPFALSDHLQLTLTRNNGTRSSWQQQGTWALFRLFDNQRLHPSLDPKFYDVTFNINGAQAKYQLVTRATINPFMPGIINTFRCPDHV